MKYGHVLRRLHEGDTTSYRSLMLQAYAQHPTAFTATVAERAAMPLEGWQKRMGCADDQDRAVFGLFEGEQLIGTAGFERNSRPKQRHAGLLLGMYVQPGHMGKGLGRQLVEAVKQHAATQAGMRTLKLTVTEGNAAAEALYRRCGFQVFGIEPMAIRDGDQYLNKVHMWLDLQADRGQ